MLIHKGKIKGFQGSWSSGIAYLLIEDSRTKVLQSIPCENTSTVRALEACFGDVISEGHTANGSGYRDKAIYWSYDEMGLLFGGFTPISEATPELIKAYKNDS